MTVYPRANRLQKQCLAWRQQGLPIALVPTMGNLHRGHISLIRKARTRVGANGRVLVSLFVNPTQFGPNEDFAGYPRTWETDRRICREEGVDALFAPAPEEIYPKKPGPPASTIVAETHLSQAMEGASRPAHFQGVTTIVAILLNITHPDYAVFGEKDFQQAAVIRQMIRDLHIPTRLVLSPTVRESDGLACSSRNTYLTPAQRREAPILRQCLLEARRQVRQAKGSIRVASLTKRLQKLMASAPLGQLDYLAFFDAHTLKFRQRTVARGDRLALAVRFGKTRLIDNGRL